MSKNKLVIVGTTLLLSVIVYSSITSMSKSNEKPKDYEYYYNEEDTSNKEEPVSTDTVPVLSHNTDDTTTIQVKANAPIDTTPESLGVFVNKEYALPADYIPPDLTEPKF